METLFDIMTGLFYFGIIGLSLVGLAFLLILLFKLWLKLFKFKCTIHAEIIAEKIKEVLEDRQIGIDEPEVDE